MLILFSIFLLLLSAPLPLANSNEDISSLLLFKSSLLHDSSNSLSSWINSTNPCSDSSSSWLGVTCNSTTHRITQLVLENLNLTGPIQPLTQLTQLRLLSLKHNHLFSTNPINFSSCLNLKHLYLSYNNLSGPFPAGVSSLRRLWRLDLSHNYLSGEIPMSELAQLPRLLTLLLESNSFTGGIDSVESASVSKLNVSGNSLSGEIPAWMARFPASSFAGNEDLCGGPSGKKCSSGDFPAKSEPAILPPVGDDGLGEKKKRMSNWVVIMIAGIVAVVILGALVAVTCFCFCRRREWSGPHADHATVKMKGGPGRPGSVRAREGGGEEREMVMFEGCKGFRDVDDLLTSSAELLGKGCVGTTYKVVVGRGKDGVVVVVKRVRERRKGRELDGWLRMIGGLRHPNAVSLRAYYNSMDELLLVYDYLPAGSLHSLLHGNRGPGRTPLGWTTRLKLASESAEGLAFLHSYNKARFFHGNLTSSNILVDRWGNACISDIGLHQLLLTPRFSNNAYLAPELISNGNTSNSNISTRKFTQKCDVYSFGVVLLEILTGKMPMGEGETSLVKWVQRVGKEEWGWELFDFELLRYKEKEAEMAALMEVALLCLAPLPRDRPKMGMVHSMIEDIRMKGGSGGCGSGPGPIMNNLSPDSSPALSEHNTNLNTCS